MSDTTVDITLLGTHVRELRRQMAMLQAGQAQLPTLDQFQAGLGEIDKQFVELGNSIAEKVTAAVNAAIGARLSTIEARLTEIAEKVSRVR